MRSFWLSLLCFIPLSAVNVCAETIDTAEGLQSKLLQRCEQMSKSLVRASFNIAVHQFVQCPIVPNQRLVNTTRLTFGRDGDKWKIDRSDIATDYFRGRFVDNQIMSELVIDDAIYEVNSNRQLSNSDAAPNIRTSISHRMENANNSALRRLLLYGNFFGDGTNTLTNLLHESRVDTDMERAEADIDGFATQLLSARGKFGTIRLWLDPTIDYLPRKFTLTKRGSDLFDNDKPVNSISEMAGKGSIFPTGKLSEYQRVIDKVRVVNFAGVKLIQAYRERLIYTFENGERLTWRYDVSLSDVNLDPKFPPEYFQITTKVPDRTPVSNLDDPRIIYVWRDGKMEIDRSLDSQSQ